MEWKDGRIYITPPKNPKKLTATRFATILGLNPWSTPFEVWCDITRTYQKPFEDTIYTVAGKIIEPKQAAYMEQEYFMDNLVRPKDVWGEDYFKKTRGDFFPEIPILGGMWDYILKDKKGNPITVLEMKTSKRVEDWEEDIPEYYALQAALYAYLLGVEEVVMVASFLENSDYDHPENFKCCPDNTITRRFRLSQRYPGFENKYVRRAIKWWRDHVESGVSPEYDEQKDAEILKALRTNHVSPETDLSDLVKEAEELKVEIDTVKKSIADKEKRYGVVTDMIKKMVVPNFRKGDTRVSITGSSFYWEVSKSTTSKINKEALKADGILEKYTVSEDSYRIITKPIEEE